MEMLLRLELKTHEDTESCPKHFNWTITEFIKGWKETGAADVPDTAQWPPDKAVVKWKWPDEARGDNPWIEVIEVYVSEPQTTQLLVWDWDEGPGWCLKGQESGWRPQLGLGRAIKASWYPQGSGKCIKVSDVKDLSLVVLSKLELRFFSSCWSNTWKPDLASVCVFIMDLLCEFR